jgi:hypothetical protein
MSPSIQNFFSLFFSLIFSHHVSREGIYQENHPGKQSDGKSGRGTEHWLTIPSLPFLDL